MAFAGEQQSGGAAPSKTITHSFVVEGECFGWRLDRFLKKKIPRLSRERVQRVIRGDCTLDGRQVKPSQTVQPGQIVVFTRPAPKEPDVPRHLGVLYEDQWLYALDKPAGLPMHPTAKFHYSTLTAVLRERFPDEALQIAHRLDRETSGIVLVARTREAAVAFKKAFFHRQITKTYVAIVHGTLMGEGLIDQPLALAGSAVRLKMAVRPDGLPSRTKYRVLSNLGNAYSIVECAPLTGRQHQIRAHLDWLGHPVVGDKLYPDEQRFADYQDFGDDAIADLPLPRQALHACALRMVHPFTKAELFVESPLPKDLSDFVAAQTLLDVDADVEARLGR